MKNTAKKPKLSELAKDPRVSEEVKKRIRIIEAEPFIVSVMGQTGVGKSSLINALFDANLEIGAIGPVTKKIKRVERVSDSGYKLWFYDLPGIGESGEADSKYLEQYSKMLKESDVVIWAIHADNRSVSFDFDSLKQLLNAFGSEERSSLISKITFVLTKADLLIPPAWILGKVDNHFGVFAPINQTQELLREKQAYYQEVFLKPYGDLIVSQTYNDSRFNTSDPRFSCTERIVRYRGYMDEGIVKQLTSQFPEHKTLFNRLYDNYQFIPCSSLFRFNLYRLMLVIVNKLGEEESIRRFQNFYRNDELSRIPLSDAKKYSNILVYDHKRDRVIFDLSEQRI